MSGYACFDGMTWPKPGERMDEVEHRLRYGEPSREDTLYAASVLAAYRQMVADPEEKRRKVVSALRKGGES